jgi:hypothetical protein
LNAKHPGAAASLREGLEDTLTVQSLGIAGALYRTQRTTNPIENLNGSLATLSALATQRKVICPSSIRALPLVAQRRRPVDRPRRAFART